MLSLKTLADPNAIWNIEACDTSANREAPLKLPTVQAAIVKGRPMINGFGERFETRPVGGHGLST